MSAKLDQSLGEIINTRRASRQGQRRRAARAHKGATAPVGGVHKSTKATKSAAKAVPNAPASGESKIIVTGLPSDVDEANIKEYFHKSAGPVKKVILTYNQNGTSRGIASIVFSRPDTAAKAAKDLNGLLIDKRPIKIEVVVDASSAPAVPATKPLTERVAQPKAQPKPVSAAKPAKAGNKRGRARRGRNAGRPKPKTKEELDAEMVDYYAAAAPPTNGTSQPATNANEDMGMDEIS